MVLQPVTHNSFHPATDDIIKYLNDLLKYDSAFVKNIMTDRISCNKHLLDHPTIQVKSGKGYQKCGVLGLLNGFCGVFADGPKKGWGPISMEVWEDGTVKQFVRTENK